MQPWRTPKKKFTNPDPNVVGGLSTVSLVDAFLNSDVYNNWRDGVDIIDNAIDDWFRDFFNDYEQLSDEYVKPMLKGDINMNGYGALVVLETERVIYNYYSDYVVIDRSKINSSGQFSYTRYYNLAEYHDWSKWDASLSSWNYGSYSSSSEWGDSRYKFYGDIRYEDGTEAETNDEYEYPLGETEDGTNVTPFLFRLNRVFLFSYQFLHYFICGYYCHLHGSLFRLNIIQTLPLLICSSRY